MIIQHQQQQQHHHFHSKIPKLVLLDRDGVINEDVGAPGVLHPQQLILTRNAGHAIARLKQAGCWIAIITNQSCVGKGLITHSQLDKIHDQLQDLLFQEHPQAHIDRIYSCTTGSTFHHAQNIPIRNRGVVGDMDHRKDNRDDDDDDPRRKPRPGMIHEAMADFGTAITPQECCWVGDTVTDLQAATSAGIDHRYLVATGYGQGLMRGLPPPLPPCPPIWIDSSASTGTSSDYESKSIPGRGGGSTMIDPSTLPFYYCQNLAHAVDWMLNPNAGECEHVETFG